MCSSIFQKQIKMSECECFTCNLFKNSKMQKYTLNNASFNKKTYLIFIIDIEFVKNSCDS